MNSRQIIVNRESVLTLSRSFDGGGRVNFLPGRKTFFASGDIPSGVSINSAIDIQNYLFYSGRPPFFLPIEITKAENVIAKVDCRVSTDSLTLDVSDGPLSFLRMTPLVGKMGSKNFLGRSFLFTHAFENISQVEIPPRAQAIRMIFLELDRVRSHLIYLGQRLSFDGNEVVSMIEVRMKKAIDVIYSSLNLGPSGEGLITAGGITRDIDGAWVNQAFQSLRELSKDLDIIRKSTLRDETLLKHSEQELHLQFDEKALIHPSGCLLRSLGISFDLRKACPFYFYKDLDFEIPLGIYGSNYDVIVIRLEEMEESLKIIEQLLDHLPSGSVKNSFDLKSLAWNPQGDHYFALELDNGEFGLYFQNSKVRLIVPSRRHLLLFCQTIIGQDFQSAKELFGRFDIDSRELGV